jgi:hypothetical protein
MSVVIIMSGFILPGTWASFATGFGRLPHLVTFSKGEGQTMVEASGACLGIRTRANEGRRSYANFTYHVGSWTKPRRVLATFVDVDRTAPKCLPAPSKATLGIPRSALA